MKEIAYGVFRLEKIIAAILRGLDTFFALWEPEQSPTLPR
jgi:hypothetical protein